MSIKATIDSNVYNNVDKINIKNSGGTVVKAITLEEITNSVSDSFWSVVESGTIANDITTTDVLDKTPTTLKEYLEQSTYVSGRLYVLAITNNTYTGTARNIAYVVYFSSSTSTTGEKSVVYNNDRTDVFINYEYSYTNGSGGIARACNVGAGSTYKLYMANPLGM